MQICGIIRFQKDVAEARFIKVGRRLKELYALERSLRRFVEECSAQCAGGPARGIILQDSYGLAAAMLWEPKSTDHDFSLTDTYTKSNLLASKSLSCWG